MLEVGVLLCYNSLPSLPSLPASSSSSLAFILQHLPSDYLILVLLKCGWGQRETQNKGVRWWSPVGQTVCASRINSLPHTSTANGVRRLCLPTLHLSISVKNDLPATLLQKVFCFSIYSFSYHLHATNEIYRFKLVRLHRPYWVVYKLVSETKRNETSLMDILLWIFLASHVVIIYETI